VYIYDNYKSTIDFRNNNLTRANAGITLFINLVNPNTTIEGNNYYNASGILLSWNGSNYSRLSAYKTVAKALGMGSTDQNMAVTYKASDDLHIDQSSKVPYGRNIGIKTDIDGDTRCDYFVTSGADESNYTGSAHYTKPSPKFFGPDTVYMGNPTVYLNSGNASDPILYKWYINGKLVSDSFDLETTAISSSGTKIKLVTYNCGGKDSLEKTISVKTQTVVPVSDFIGSLTSAGIGSIIKLQDESTNFPSGWKWEITPEYTLVNGQKQPNYAIIYGSFSSPNLKLKFNFPGQYKVCLTASNAKGSGNTECKTNYLEIIPSNNLGKNVTLNYSKGYLYDNGGPNNNASGNYVQDKAVIGGCTDSVYLVFTKFDIACGMDYIRLFEGKDASGTSLNKCSANSYAGSNFGASGYTGGPASSTTGCVFVSAPGCIPKVTDTFKAKGFMYVEMGVYGYTTAPGFEAYYWTTPSKEKPPVAMFEIPDSICTNNLNIFKNTSTGKDVSYLWDLDGDLSEFETVKKDPEWSYYMDGLVTVTLVAQNCGGTDTFRKTLVVHNPVTPIIAFSADNTYPTTADIVFFKSEIKQCTDTYKWTFTPASGNGKALYVNGTKNTSPYPQLTFTDTGCYAVTLEAGNTTGAATLTKTCYVIVKKPYCIPAVNTLNADVGISKVAFHTIKNSSTQGANPYNNYLSDLTNAATLEEGLTYKLTVERSTNKNKATRTVWIDWNLDGDFNDTLELVGQEVNAINLSWNISIKMPDIAQYGATVMRIGIDLGSQKASPCGKNQTGEFEDYRLYLGPYLTKPEITLAGNQTVILEQGNIYTDSGATAYSTRFGDITKDIIINRPAANFTKQSGNYKFTYDVTDSAGNKALQRVRTIKVTPDVTPPELILEQPYTVYLQVYTPFAAPKILKALDLVDSNRIIISVKSNVDLTLLGYYTYEVTATDTRKNTITVARQIIVIDTVLPVLTLVGNSIIYHEVGYAYTDAGVNMKDNYTPNADLQSGLEIESNVDAFTTGEYYVTYNLTDPNTGKIISVTRKVIVRDTEKPVLTLNGNETDTLDVYNTYNDQAVSISDNYDKKLTYKLDGTFYKTFPDGKGTQLGNYEIIYVVIDGSGNTSKLSRNIIVKDRKAPVVTLKGEQTENVCRWSKYEDKGADVSDNFYSASDISITKEGTILTAETSLEGIYTLRYIATDKSGNVGYSSYRYIYVRNPYNFPCTTATAIKANVTLDKLVKVYPNPNAGKFTVEANLPVNEQVRISVTNLLGQEVAVIS
ncbi:MAG: DUF5011 domain-containing protein, partial [Sphingobacteriaceae bacterium]